MSSPVWRERGYSKRQRLWRRPLVLALRAEGITWPPVVGQLVCDCRYRHVRVKSVNPDWDDAVMEDGFGCSIDHCLGPADHDESVHAVTDL